MNFCDKNGALEIKKRIEAYWAQQGLYPNLHFTKGQFHQLVRCDRVDVRSNMVNGMPVKIKGKK